AVRDVLAGEGVLVHLRAHVAGVDREHPQVRSLDGQDGAEVVERRLRDPVGAPPLVGLDGGVGGDVHDHGVRGERGTAAWISPSGATTLTSNRSRTAWRGTSVSAGSGDGPSPPALLTSRWIGCGAAATSSARW